MKSACAALSAVSYPYQPPPQYPQQYPAWPPAAPRASSTVPAYLSAALFAVCGFLTLFLGIVTWGGNENPHVVVSLVGVLYAERVTGNTDFGISMTMTVACTTLTFAFVYLARLATMRWILAGLGGLVTAYYGCALLVLVVHGGIRFVPLPMFAFVLWLAATAVSLLPATARAMRRTRLLSMLQG